MITQNLKSFRYISRTWGTNGTSAFQNSRNKVQNSHEVGELMGWSTSNMQERNLRRKHVSPIGMPSRHVGWSNKLSLSTSGITRGMQAAQGAAPRGCSPSTEDEPTTSIHAPAFALLLTVPHLVLALMNAPEGHSDIHTSRQKQCVRYKVTVTGKDSVKGQRMERCYIRVKEQTVKQQKVLHIKKAQGESDIGH